MSRTYREWLDWEPGIFGYSWDILPFYERVAQELPDNCRVVEVGSLYGRSILFLAQQLAQQGKTAELTAVDSWAWSQHPTALAGFLGNRDRLELHVREMQLESLAAAERFPELSLDLVFIDADHSFEAVRADIAAWGPKVKPGGILSGHDYHRDQDVHVGVSRAVNEAFRAGEIAVEASVWWVRLG